MIENENIIDAYVVYKFVYNEKDKTCRREEVLFVFGRKDLAIDKINEIADLVFRCEKYKEYKLPTGFSFTNGDRTIELVYRKGHVEF